MARLRLALLAALAAIAAITVAPAAPVAASAAAATPVADAAGASATLADLASSDFATAAAAVGVTDAAVEAADGSDAAADAAAEAADGAQAAADDAAPAALDPASRQWRARRAARRRARKARATTCLVRSGGWYMRPRWARHNGMVVYFRKVVTSRVAADGVRVGRTRTVVKGWECRRRWGRWPPRYRCDAAGDVGRLCAGKWWRLRRFKALCNRRALTRTWVRPPVPAEGLVKCDDVPAPSPEY